MTTTYTTNSGCDLSPLVAQTRLAAFDNAAPFTDTDQPEWVAVFAAADGMAHSSLRPHPTLEAAREATHAVFLAEPWRCPLNGDMDDVFYVGGGGEVFVRDNGLGRFVQL